MNYGFENGKFYIDIKSCSRPADNMRQELERRAIEVVNSGKKTYLGSSGGIDSQTVLHSFISQDLPIETVFLYLPKYNENEFNQVKELDRKYGIKTQIIDIDIDACKEEILHLSKELNAPKSRVLRRKFLSMLPSDVDYTEMISDPCIIVSPKNNYYYFDGYQLSTTIQHRLLNGLNRSGIAYDFGNFPEYIFSVINDDIYKAALISSKYFDGNNLNKKTAQLIFFDRYDYYIKPILVAKYWKDELIYFPKFTGVEKISWIYREEDFLPMRYRQHAIAVPYDEMLDFLKNTNSLTKRIYENVSHE